MAQAHKGMSAMQRLWVHIFALQKGKKPEVEFRHSTRNASKYSAKSGERNVLTLGSPCLH